MNDIEQKIYEEVVETNKQANETIKCLVMAVNKYRVELHNCRNELCLRCGQYKNAHLGACDDCRYRHGGEWSDGIDE